MSPARKREAVVKLQVELGVSERRACWVLSQPRSSQRLRSKPRDDEAPLVKRMLELVRQRPRFGYQPYGQSEPLDPDFTTYSGTDNLWEYRFTGRDLDLESGMQINRMRYYHQQLGRWISQDPIGYVDIASLYAYANDSPVLLADSIGLAPGDRSNCLRVQRKYNIELRSIRGTIPIVEPIGFYFSISLKAEVDLNSETCDICCKSGGTGKETRVTARARFGLAGTVVGGWEGSVDFGGGKFSGYNRNSRGGMGICAC